MKVVAKKGARCPLEGKPRNYISDSIAVEVPDTAYYRRLVQDGSLVEAKEKVKTVKKTDQETTKITTKKKSSNQSNKGGK